MVHAYKYTKKIVTAALKVFAINSRASLEAVAGHGGIGRATLFRYFSGRKALIRELFFESLTVCIEAIAPFTRNEGNPEQRLHNAVEALMLHGSAFAFLHDEQWNTEDEELCTLEQRYFKEWHLLFEVM